MPRYGFLVMFVCAMGACSDDEAKYAAEPMVDATTRCVCKPTMTLESGAGAPLCNNASVDWLLQTVMEEMSSLHDQLDARQTELTRLTTALKHKEELLESQHQMIADQTQQTKQLQQQQNDLKAENQKLKEEVEWLNVAHAKVHVRPKDCADVQNYGFHYSGVYSVYPSRASDYSRDGIEVFCDLNTDGGGWTVFQRRQDGSADFAQNWESYKHGFGTIAREFWLGNEKVFYILKQRSYELRVDLTDFKGNRFYASYKVFWLEDEENLYRIHVGEYSGTAGDALKHHNKAAFSTADRDNDESETGNCAELFGKGGWWYKRCYDSNLNGIYTNQHLFETIVWYQLHKDHEPMRHVEMKIRPVGFSNEEF